MKVVPVPCLRDNYAYLLIDPETNEAAVVDPSEPKPVLREIKRLNLKLTAILNTHHHPDHVGGNKKLVKKFPDVKVYAHVSDRGRIPFQTDFLEEGDTVEILNGQKGHITHNPGHTTGAVTFYFGDAAFTGDTLFAAGCGRLFEGTPEDMYVSLNEKIGRHDADTKLYFGHEYTENNLRFALSVEPNNPQVKEKLELVEIQRKAGEFTTPTTIASEKQTNPFMRCDSPEILATVKKHDPQNDLSPASVLKVIRELKDRF